ncbi:UNVERIFIED_CONTAM: hypothetical protein ABIE34_001624 [Jeotgalibacillus campisalis]
MTAEQARNASLMGPPFAMYHGMPTDTVDVEAGFPVTPDFSAAGDVVNGRLPGSGRHRRASPPPTNGAAGIISAVLHYYTMFTPGATKNP